MIFVKLIVYLASISIHLGAGSLRKSAQNMVNTYWKTSSYQTCNVKLFCCAFSFSRLPAEARQNDAVKHALSVRAAVSTGNYVAYFRLYKTAPNLNTCLMGVFCSEWLII